MKIQVVNGNEENGSRSENRVNENKNGKLEMKKSKNWSSNLRGKLHQQNKTEDIEDTIEGSTYPFPS